MKEEKEMINAIAKEINQHYQALKEQILKKVLEGKSNLGYVYFLYIEKYFPQITEKEFAAIYAQTVIFILLIEALFPSKRIIEDDIYNIFYKTIYRLRYIDASLHEVLEPIKKLDIPVELRNFITASKDKISGSISGDIKEGDMLALVYQRFLMQYEPGLHKKIRYYYTPKPVVWFMVYTIHQLLKEKLNIDDGLAAPDISILDPSSGTGNFLEAVLQLAIAEKTKKYGEGIMIPFTVCYFTGNIFGFEVMLPLYVMGFINLCKMIENVCPLVQGYYWDPIANVYLNDTLAYREKSGIASEIKSINVIFCNPPYSRHSLNKGERITRLVRDYYQVNNRPIKEKNLKGLQDDYVKFFRFAQWEIDRNGSGVMGFITSNSYLENPTFRGMRYSLLKSFDEIYILDLHGEAREVDKKDGDENIFGIGQGIAIGFFIKQKRPGKTGENPGILDCRVFYYGMKGSKASKLNYLQELKGTNYKAVEWERLFPEEDFYMFTPVEKKDIYRQFIKITEIFPVHGTGIVTARDKLTIKKSKNGVYNIIRDFNSFDEKYIKKIYQLGDDTRDWQLKEAKKDIIESFANMCMIVPILYRPFDIRYTYYTGKTRGFLCMPRAGVMRHMLGERENIGLVTVRQVPGGVFSHCFAADTIIESRITSGQKGIAYIFPLYKYIFPKAKDKKSDFNYYHVYPGIDMPRQCNINPVVFSRLKEIFAGDEVPTAGQIFYYIYAILNSGIYRERYRDHLKIDFPRVPFTRDVELFMKLSGLGEGLAAVHLFKSVELHRTFSKFEVPGENLVEYPHFKHEACGVGRVYINETQYFSNIRKELWELKVCGYQVLKKWLQVRKKGELTQGEILHYIKICRALELTVKYRKEIDVLYSQLEKTL